MSDQKNQEKYPTIRVRVSQSEWLKFMKFREEGLSAREVLEISGRPCECCRNTSIVVFDRKQGNQVKVPRGILKNKRP